MKTIIASFTARFIGNIIGKSDPKSYTNVIVYSGQANDVILASGMANIAY